MKFILAAGVAALLLVSCSKTPASVSKAYFDFDSLIHKQIGLIEPFDSLRKESVMGHVKDKAKLSLDTLLLTNELDIFKQLEVINRPLYHGLYEKYDGLADPKSNLKVRLLKATVKSPVPFVRFYYQEEPHKLRKIEAAFEETNSLYSTHRDMVIEFDWTKGKSILTHYSISGGQKMIMSDSVTFRVEATVLRSSH